MSPFMSALLLYSIARTTVSGEVDIRSSQQAELLKFALSDKSIGKEVLENQTSNGFPWKTHGPSEYHNPKTLAFHEPFTKLDSIFESLRVSDGFKPGFLLPRVSHHMIEMRDGIKLSTWVINPMPHRKRKGAILSRSPYGPTTDQIADIFMAMNGYAAVIQDQRGTFKSEGNFSMWKKDGDDGYDTMKWISEQDWSNGEIYAAGISADGCGALTQLLDSPKWLKGQFIVLATADAHKTLYPGGAFRKGLVEGWMTAMSVMTKGYSLKHTLTDIMKHEALSNFYDKIEAVDKLELVRYPTVHLTGWWDIFQNEQIEAWNGFSTRSHISVRNNHAIFVLPLGHCGLMHANNTKQFMNGESFGWHWSFKYAAEMFRNDLDGEAHRKFDRVNFYVQGSSQNLLYDIGNYWVAMKDWPKQKPLRFYLSKEESLVMDRFSKVRPGKSTYVYDPLKTAPTIGGNNFILQIDGYGCGSMDQRRTEARKDVIIFTTPKPLKQAIVITGKVIAELYVSSDSNDTDFVVSLTDVHPGGESMQVRYGVQRMKWRYIAKEPALLDEDVVYLIRIDMWFTSYVFNKGHRIRLSITSSSDPYIKPNNNLNEDVFVQTTKRGRKSTNTVLYSPNDYPSFVELPVVDINDLAHNKVNII